MQLYRIKRIREGFYGVLNTAGETLCHTEDYQEALDVVFLLKGSRKFTQSKHFSDKNDTIRNRS